MKEIELIATSTFGLEAVVRRELENLGYEDIKLENGRAHYKGDLRDIVKSNLWLRVADRVLIRVGEFKATTFEELYDQTIQLPWGDWIPEDANFIINGKSIKSKLFSISDCQRIVERAIVDKLNEKYNVGWFEKTGPRYNIEVSLLNDIATLTIDTSGVGLHKRGYRTQQGEAPIKETLAAAMIQLSYWNKDRVLFDPFCGSGTILIEAAMIGRNIAPGLDRTFDSEEWSIIPKEIWKEERQDAMSKIDYETELNLIGCDIDRNAILIARENASNLGFEDDIVFFAKDFREAIIFDEYGVLITNPPYGERLGEAEEVRGLYEDLGDMMREFPTWSNYVITSDKSFEKHFKNKADRKRKLYNGRIEVDYYQFFGPPPKRKN